jgi:hypothetical protein
MADNKAAAALSFVTLPLEVRHVVFKHASARDVNPKKLLRYWFEKKEVKQLIAQELADNPNGPAPQVAHHEDSEDSSDVMEQEDGEDGDSEDGENEGNVDDDDHDDQDEDEDEDELGEDEDAMEENGDVQGMLQALSSGQVPPLPSHTQTAVQAQSHDDDAGEMDEAEVQDADEHAQGTVDDDGDEAMDDEDDNEASADENNGDGDMAIGGDTDGTAAPQPPPVPASIVSAARKWRYIPNFMCITHCPPPVELLLASQQLNVEAKSWFYDVAVLRIDATGSFAHTSFFEEAFSQITDAAFSPMENIRKVEVTFAWDTTWLRAEETGYAKATFPALLRQRSEFVYLILLKAPELEKLTIHWHDSAQDNESANFMLDILAAFHTLKGEVKIQEHYIAADTKPYKKSVAGKRRIEFQAIADAGLDRLF